MKAVVEHAAKTWSILTAVVMISAWLAISNHCVLGAAMTAPKADTSTDECPFHSKPPPPPAKQKQRSDLPCCKILRALASAPAKAFTRLTTDFIDLFPRFVLLAPPKISFAASTLDTGPPGAHSFAELILQRSILAHAPPFRLR